jgi:D-alanyl-D-alanine carboxypeptidase
MLLPLALAACGGGGARLSQGGYGQHYVAPGPAADPWRPYIMQASARFSVPPGWIRAIIRQESGGHEYLHGRPVTSDAGAMGLMQLMPATYAELRDRFGLGNDPYDPHDNIMAGTGYIAELYARYGAPAFLVAYDAGPRRMDDYNAGRGTLPNETVAYLASVAPALAREGPMTGPLAAYADAGGQPRAPVQVYAANMRTLGGCWRDPDAAYDPDDKCNRATPPASAPVQTARSGSPTRQGAVLWGSGSAPGPAPAQPQPQIFAAAAPRHARFALIASAQADPVRMSTADAGWGVQVGAFANPDQARQVAESARRMAPEELASAQTTLGTTAPFGGQTLYRARLIGITHPAAETACGRLTAQSWACLTVPPGG